ncbi:MAG: flippase-like domain-containing protein [Proteobacteria bacterium]|nr:flippase-like domain-containing protein [Pseudomonadota bacterium]MBU4036491.1 flippase-like domain-containing protein [Pseudomonadota bacterium]
MNSKRVKVFIYLLLSTILLYFVGKAIIRQIDNINWDTLRFNYTFLVLAILSDIISRIFAGILYSSLLRRLEAFLPHHVAMSISWLSLLGKYIPGKIAVLGSGMFLLSRYKVRPEITVIVPVLANGMFIISCLFLSLPLFFSQPAGNIIPFSQAWFFLLLFIGIIAMHPKMFLGLANWMLRLIKRPSLQTGLTFKQMLLPFCIVLAQCIFLGITTWCVMKALTIISVSAIPVVISISVLAGTLGFLAFFSPAGLGVREGIYLLTLSPFIGSEMAVLTAVCLRMLQTAMDALMGATALGLLRLTNTHEKIKNV